MMPPQAPKNSDKGAEISGTEISSRRDFLRRIAPLVIMLLIGLAIIILGAGKLFSLEAVMRHLMAAQDFTNQSGLLFLVGFIAFYTLAVAFSLPLALILTISGGFLFGWVAGALIGIFAKTFGSLVLFLVARHGFSDLLSRHAGPRLAAIEAQIRSDSFFYLLFLRIQPVVPFFVVNLAAALFEVRTGIFIIATAIGIAPGAFISSFTGTGLSDIVERNRPFFTACMQDDSAACEQLFSLAALWSPKAFIALLLLALLALLPLILRRWTKIGRLP